MAFLEEYKQSVETVDRAMLVDVARTSLRTKLHTELADHLTEIVVDSIECVRREVLSKDDTVALDLHMIEIMHMKHQSALDTKFVDGLVLDHGKQQNY